MTSFFGILFYQSIPLSESHDLTFFREIDDFALQLGLRLFHESVFKIDIKPWMSTFSYGYGNLFWVINSLITLPFYVLKSDQLVLIIPRVFSLLLMISSCFLIGRIVLNQTKSYFLYYVSVLSLFTVPTVGEWTTRLHVNCLNVFFGCLSLYLGTLFIEKRQAKFYYSCICSLGICVGLKLTGLFWVPPILAYLFLQIQEKKILLNGFSLFSKKNLFLTFFSLIIPFLFTINPSVFFSFDAIVNTFNILKYYITYKDVNIGPIINENSWYIFNKGLFDYYWSNFLFAILLSASLFSILKPLNKLSVLSKSISELTTIVFIWVLFMLTYLTLNLKKGPFYLNSYFFTIYPIIGILWINLNNFVQNKLYAKMFISTLIAFNFLFNFESWKKQWFRHSIKANSKNYMIQKKMTSVVRPKMLSYLEEHKKLSLIIPPGSSTPVSQFTAGVRVLTSADFDLLRGRKCENETADFIIFRQQDIPTIGKIANSTPHEYYENSKNDVQNFINTQTCGAVKFENIYFSDDIYVYQRKI